LIFLQVLLVAQECYLRVLLWITAISHTNEAEACPFWVLPCVNDAGDALFVHFVYSLAVSIRKPLPATVQQNPRIKCGALRPRSQLPQSRAIGPTDH
jgi:hypothetical protein